MKSPARASILLIAALLVAWHGLLLATPHIHADITVPQEELACSASHSSSQTNHLHGSGSPIPLHPCLACSTGPTHADTISIVDADVVPVADELFQSVSTVMRSRDCTRLPLLRGPPISL